GHGGFRFRGRAAGARAGAGPLPLDRRDNDVDPPHRPERGRQADRRAGQDLSAAAPAKDPPALTNQADHALCRATFATLPRGASPARPSAFQDKTMHRYRSHTCAALRKSDVGGTVRLSGWVHRVRDHGGVLFIDLRDHYGITQVVADPDSKAFKLAEAVRGEWVIRIDGLVKARTEDT